MIKTSLCILLSFAPAAFACAKFFQPFNIPSTPFEKSKITFAENEFGPQVDGWTFKVNGKAATGVFFGGRKKTWCAVLQDKKDGVSLDCSVLNANKAGVNGSGNLIWVSDARSEGPARAIAVHSDENTLTIYALDPHKPMNPKDPMASVDPSKPEIVLKGVINVNEKNVATASIDVLVWDPASNRSVGEAVHSVKGTFSTASAQIARPQVRQNGPPGPFKPLTAFNLVGSSYTGPDQCGFGKVGTYTPPTDERRDRLPAKSN